MAVHVKCPSCKQQVPFGRLFCTFCGEKLELTQESVTTRMTAGEAYDGIRRWVIRLFSLAVVAGVIGVFFWPMEPQGQTGTAAHATSCQAKITSARARAYNGLVFIEQFSEQEVNALLAERVKNTTDKEAGVGFQLTDVNVALLPGKAVVNTRLALGGAVLAYEVEVEPSISSKGFEHKITALRIGHVPVPAAAAGYLGGRALNLFSTLTTEAEVLSKMKSLSLDKGVVRISTQGK